MREAGATGLLFILIFISAVNKKRKPRSDGHQGQHKDGLFVKNLKKRACGM
jgi:hypothetical protein